MNKKYLQADGVLTIAAKRIELPFPAVEIVECGGLIVVRVDAPAGTVFNRNVFAFSCEGDIVWQIEACPHGTELDKPFVGISCKDNDQVVAANWIGVDYKVNMLVGSISAIAFDK